jgi:hypothetical protein
MMNDRKSRDQEIADEMVGLLTEVGANITVEDVRQALLLGIKIGRADQALSRPIFEFDAID